MKLETRNMKQENMIQDSRFQIQDQKGVTLLISVLVLSGLTLVSLAVASFASQEIRSSRAVVLAEPAIAAAESAGEQGLWAIKRAGSVTCSTSSTSPQTNSLNNGAALSSYYKSYSAGTITLEAGAPFEFFLYDPCDVNGNLDLSGFPFNYLSIANQSQSFAVTVHLSRLDGTPITPEPAGITIVPNGFQSIPIPAVTSGTEGRMQVTVESAGDATVDIDTNQGLPNFPTVNASGCASRTQVSDCDDNSQELFSRRINIIVPQ